MGNVDDGNDGQHTTDKNNDDDDDDERQLSVGDLDAVTCTPHTHSLNPLNPLNPSVAAD